jgi:hypothetical protein
MPTSPQRRRSAPSGLSLAGADASPPQAPAYGEAVRSPEPEPVPQDFTSVVDALLSAGHARAGLDPEMITDPMLPEVTWSWLEEALAEREAGFSALAGTVTTTASARFGQLREEDDTCEVELRCSWSPEWSTDDPASIASHLEALCDLMTMMAGEPPSNGVVSLTSRVR